MTGNEDMIYESYRRRHDELGGSKRNAIAFVVGEAEKRKV